MIVSTLKLTAQEKKVLKYQLGENQKTIDKMIAAGNLSEEDLKDFISFQNTNNSILRKLF